MLYASAAWLPVLLLGTSLNSIHEILGRTIEAGQVQIL
jgi:hypothetical protein